MRRVLCQLSESASKTHVLLKVTEEELLSFQARISSCQQLLTTWGLNVALRAGEDKALAALKHTSVAEPVEAVSSRAISIVYLYRPFCSYHKAQHYLHNRTSWLM